MHPDHVPDPRFFLKSTSSQTAASREAADTRVNGDRRRDLSARLPPDILVRSRPENRGDTSKPSAAAALSYDEVVVRVREVWADVLGGDSSEAVPLDVDFFEFGGSSLLLVMLWDELQPIASRRLKLSELFHHGTVQAQAELLTARPERGGPGGAS